MYLTIKLPDMNYEALGRYTEGKEAAERLAVQLHNHMIQIGRAVSTGVTPANEARQYDFQSIRQLVTEGESIQDELTKAIELANQAAPACGRELLKVRPK